MEALNAPQMTIVYKRHNL